MKTYKIIERKIKEKEITIKGKTERDAIELYLTINDKTDLLDNNNYEDDSEESFELDIYEVDDDINDEYVEEDEYEPIEKEI